MCVAPYHAASNGAADKLVKSCKCTITASKSVDSIHRHLGNFLLTYRTAEHATTGCTPAQLFLGRELRTRMSSVRQSVKDKVLQWQSDHTAHHNKHLHLHKFYPGTQRSSPTLDGDTEGIWGYIHDTLATHSPLHCSQKVTVQKDKSMAPKQRP